MIRTAAVSVTAFHKLGTSLSSLAASLREDLHFRRAATVALVGQTGPIAERTARRLAGQLGRGLLRVDLSEVVSKYIGETEKNLNMLFQEAEARDWVLFFDEADALFGNRSEVKDSHDRYANIEVNYLLQRLESFSGLLLLALNADHHLHRLHARRRRVVIPHPNT